MLSCLISLQKKCILKLYFLWLFFLSKTISTVCKFRLQARSLKLYMPLHIPDVVFMEYMAFYVYVINNFVSLWNENCNFGENIFLFTVRFLVLFIPLRDLCGMESESKVEMNHKKEKKWLFTGSSKSMWFGDAIWRGFGVCSKRIYIFHLVL